MQVTEIQLQDIANVKIGCVQNTTAKTGVSVVVFPHGAVAGVDISGGGPASRETPVLSPVTAPTPVNAIVLAGGSAYGLAAGNGVMNYLEQQGIGYDTHYALVPIVCQSDLYDLNYGSSSIRPDEQMGYDACKNAIEKNEHPQGPFGAGCGATTGKLLGMKRASKSGVGIYAVQIGSVKIAAITAVNAFGDIFDYKTSEKISGLTTEDRKGWTDFREPFYSVTTPQKGFIRNNTTLSIIITNAAFDKAQLTKISAMARNAYARCINPVGTLSDGDTIYAASCGTEIADMNLVGTLGAEVLSEAIKRSVLNSKISNDEFLKCVQ